MKAALITIVIVAALIGGAAFLYFTRTPLAPSEDINEPIVTDTQSDTETVDRYTISSGSSARFEINEILRDEPFTAVGTTSEIGGTVSYEDGALAIGMIRINARTFKTDSERRDGAIANAILRSDQPDNEFIVFVPTSITTTGGMSYTITGDLTISGRTNTETLNVVLASVTDSEIRGTAEGRIKRSSYGLTIPDVPFVASVEDEFTIKADIVASK